ncbi:VIT family protein [Sporolactobacillus terrae]|uniref:Membrane protein n=1 Tax=Sporolactobacillus terrae TaxID=269673 RepID=A0A5K7WZ83_9BACL|nr:VIT family protein [Sporolactobacillus terrae]BBN97653.1 membrane protein [Sporolactobacillus terrae]
MIQSKVTKQTMSEKLNTLRAGVLGSNDGILTVVGVLFSVGAATTNHFTILIAGLSDLIACAFSMAAGEYASVSTQKDTEHAVVEKERSLLESNCALQLQQVADYYQTKGVTSKTAYAIAQELMARRPLQTIVDVKHNIQLGHYMNPWFAACASLISAAMGGCLPLLALTFLPENAQWPGTIGAVILSVALTGFLGAKLGRGFVKKAIIRNVIIGIFTMLIHYYVGVLIV